MFAAESSMCKTSMIDVPLHEAEEKEIYDIIIKIAIQVPLRSTQILSILA
jgi:hypothetical protein